VVKPSGEALLLPGPHSMAFHPKLLTSAMSVRGFFHASLARFPMAEATGFSTFITLETGSGLVA
jgi:hypothetical protein